MTHDNIFESTCDALVNPVNCVGVMGGGLARSFRDRYPKMNEAYQHVCARGEMLIGRMWTWHSARQDRWIINFPTKTDWRCPSKIEYIEMGLQDLLRVIADLHLNSIAIPALGCGLGGLEWDRVETLIKYYLGDLPPDVCVEIYPPEGKKYRL